MAKRWYVVHAYSGFEKKVASSLKERVELNKMEEFFGEILVPTEEVVEMRGGQKRKSERKFFPGYVLVQMELNDDTWHLVKDTPRVMGFIGGKADHTDYRKGSSFFSEWMTRLRSPSRKRFSSRARWCALLTVRLTTSTVWLRK